MNPSFQAFLCNFYQTPNGQKLLTHEQALVDVALKKVFGYHLVQLGITTQANQTDFLATSRIQHKILVDTELSSPLVQPGKSKVIADLDYLPFQADTIDAVFMPHTLETVADPYHLLRQVDRLICPEGHLILTGFNPIGCSILRNRLGCHRQAFKSANLMRMSRVIDWLNVLGYEIEWIEYSQFSCFNRPVHPKIKMAWLEKLCCKLGLELGNVYCILAKKRIESPTPIGLNWQLSNWLPRRKSELALSRQQHKSKMETQKPHEKN